MNPSNELRLSVSDIINEMDVRPTHVPLALLGQFQKDVADFVKGSDRDIDLMSIQISIEEGSLAFFASGLLAVSTLWADIEYLERGSSLSKIDPKRAAVIERWQKAAKQHSHRRYVVAAAEKTIFFSVDSSTDFRVSEEAWVLVEKYLHGRILDMGGKKTPNVHLELEGGMTIKIGSSQELLAAGEENRLYRSALLHVTAEENLTTGELRAIHLLGFENHRPQYDAEEFQLMVSRGTQAWSDVPEQANWLESLRGGGA